MLVFNLSGFCFHDNTGGSSYTCELISYFHDIIAEAVETTFQLDISAARE